MIGPAAGYLPTVSEKALSVTSPIDPSVDGLGIAHSIPGWRGIEAPIAAAPRER
jgi:hypothetical protein